VVETSGQSMTSTETYRVAGDPRRLELAIRVSLIGASKIEGKRVFDAAPAGVR
jgi:hypothetical protein